MTEEPLPVSTQIFTLVRLPNYEKGLARLLKKEPGLHELGRAAVVSAIAGKRLDVIPGLGGWAKLRLASPSQGRGKSGGFRLIYLVMYVGNTVYFQDVYFKAKKTDLTAMEKKQLKAMAALFKKAHRDE